MELILNIGNYAKGQFEFYDKFENLTNIEPGTLKLTPQDSEVGDIKYPEGNPHAFEVYSKKKAAQTIVLWEGDADRGDGVKKVTGSFALTVLPGDAESASVAINFSPQIPIPETTEEQTTAPETTQPETTEGQPETTAPETTEGQPETTEAQEEPEENL